MNAERDEATERRRRGLGWPGGREKYYESKKGEGALSGRKPEEASVYGRGGRKPVGRENQEEKGGGVPTATGPGKERKP